MKNRIKELRNNLGYSQTRFAEAISISRSAMAKLESGENIPSEQTIKLICKVFRTNENWLRTGEGEMFIPRNQEDDIAEFVADLFMGNSDSFKHRLISVLARMTEERWELLEEIAEQITKKE